ncbi:hypothetical protein UA08_04240 [Talaromyces atroroseus]|uniref:Rhodopsin domain-containing protein n=1 Tax=Talaromyces atroroseus TaxID=1441469 RepID=A0A1Q5Q8W0_TALAT|nr:hypothetical protein UA08_04240 [Talaromyces atroroseus]OKL60390.1 hypothetical protein UA08_04240 [Talaromyces atroroseus]
MSALSPDTLSHLLNYPSQPPPAGVTPNFVNPSSIAYQVYVTAGVCISLMVVFSLLRLISKTYFPQKPTNVGEESVTGGSFGRHAWDVLLGAFTKPQLVLSLLVEITGPLAICAVKVSVLILYLRIFSVLRWMRIVSIGSIIVITAWHLSMSIAFAAMCAPSPSAGASQLDFLSAYVSSTCTHTRVLVVFQGASNVAIDLFLLVLPLPAIWSGQMPLRRKLATSAMFSIGLSACASSIIGLVYRVRFYRIGSDNTYLVVPLWATAIAEEAAGVVVCCLPAAAVVFRSVRQRPTGYKRSEDSANSNYSQLYSRSSSNRIWSDTEADSYALLQMQSGIVKKTDLEVLGRRV